LLNREKEIDKEYCDLPATLKDVEKFKLICKHLNVSLTLEKLEASKKDMVKLLEEVDDEIENSKGNVLVLFCYAGHSCLIESFVSLNLDQGDGEFKIESLLRQFSGRPNVYVVGIYDSCRSYPKIQPGSGNFRGSEGKVNKYIGIYGSVPGKGVNAYSVLMKSLLDFFDSMNGRI